MIVIDNTSIVKVNELTLFNNKILAFVEDSQDATILADTFNNETEAEAAFNKIAETVKEHGENIVIDFRRLGGE